VLGPRPIRYANDRDGRQRGSRSAARQRAKLQRQLYERTAERDEALAQRAAAATPDPATAARAGSGRGPAGDGPGCGTRAAIGNADSPAGSCRDGRRQMLHLQRLLVLPMGYHTKTARQFGRVWLLAASIMFAAVCGTPATGETLEDLKGFSIEVSWTQHGSFNHPPDLKWYVQIQKDKLRVYVSDKGNIFDYEQFTPEYSPQFTWYRVTPLDRTTDVGFGLLRTWTIIDGEVHPVLTGHGR
jgi:hypothetical protein